MMDPALAAALRARVPPPPQSGKVACLGGSFNPPHLGHALLALSVLAVEDVDALWVLPCNDHPFAKSLAPLHHRMAMCALAFAPLGGQVHVLDVESLLPTPSYSVQTMRALRELYPSLQPRWIIGSDILSELSLWREPDELARLAPFIVIPRAGHPGTGTLDVALPEISSTDVRDRLARGQSVRGSIDRHVLRYVQAQGLYGDAGENPPPTDEHR